LLEGFQAMLACPFDKDRVKKDVRETWYKPDNRGHGIFIL
jgi:hypothetical protein